MASQTILFWKDLVAAGIAGRTLMKQSNLWIFQIQNISTLCSMHQWWIRWTGWFWCITKREHNQECVRPVIHHGTKNLWSFLHQRKFIVSNCGGMKGIYFSQQWTKENWYQGTCIKKHMSTATPILVIISTSSGGSSDYSISCLCTSTITDVFWPKEHSFGFNALQWFTFSFSDFFYLW